MTLLRRIFSIDLRSLAIFRIALGLMVAIDAIQKIFLARTFYSDWGIMPRTYWIENYMVPGKFSFFLASGDAWFAQLLLGILAGAGICFALGYRTKLANWIAFALACSLQSRNNLILSAADEVMRLSLLWSIFLPMQARFSLDSDARSKDDSIFSISSAALLLQLVYVYFFTAILKWHPVWTQEFSAIYYALNIDIFAKPLGVFLRDFVGLTRFLTASTLAWEFVGPFLALTPIPRLRLWSSLLFIGFHFGLYLSFNLGLFPWLMMAYWVIFFPAEFWDGAIGRKISAAIEARLAQIRERLPQQTEVTSIKRMPLAEAIALLAFLLVTAINLDSVKAIRAPKFLYRLTNLTYLNQTWDMFAPYPIRNDGWFVIEGTFQDGSKRDLFTGQPASYEKPAHPADAYPTSEWRKFMVTVWDNGSDKIMLPFGRFLCRKYSVAEGENSNVATIRIDFVKETTPPIGQPWPPATTVNLWNHDCSR